MLNFKKVVAREKATDKDRQKTGQKSYEEKVKKLLTSCTNFGNYLKNNVSSKTEYSEIAEKFQDKNMFKDQMAKNRLTSRTSKILNEMRKRLSKIKGTFNPQDQTKLLAAFEFTPKKANEKTGRIKRSAIDDAEVVKFFQKDIPSALMNIARKEAAASCKAVETGKKLIAKATAMKEEASNQKSVAKDAVSDFNEAKKINSIKPAAMEKQDEIKQQISSGTQNANNLRASIKKLEKLQNEMEEKSKALKEEITAKTPAANKINELAQFSNDAIKNVEKSKNDLESKTNELANSTATINKIISNAEEKGPFDEETKTFTIRSNDDFEKTKKYKSKITKIIIAGENIRTINKKAFCGLSNLESVTMGASTENINDEAFSGLSKLRVVTLGANTTKIHKAAFSRCTSLVAIDLKNVKSIGENAFSGCTALEGVNLANVASVSANAFNGCTALTGVSLGKAKIIAQGAFSGCTALKDILSAQSVTTIQKNAFSECKSLATVSLENVTSVGEKAFDSCTALTNVNLKNAKTIGDSVFNGCTALKNADLEKSETIGANAFNSCAALETVNLKSAKTIGDDAFNGCKAIQSVITPLTEEGHKYVKKTILDQAGLNRKKNNMLKRLFTLQNIEFKKSK